MNEQVVSVWAEVRLGMGVSPALLSHLSLALKVSEGRDNVEIACDNPNLLLIREFLRLQ
jgi:hypothetical protein